MLSNVRGYGLLFRSKGLDQGLGVSGLGVKVHSLRIEFRGSADFVVRDQKFRGYDSVSRVTDSEGFLYGFGRIPLRIRKDSFTDSEGFLYGFGDKALV